MDAKRLGAQASRLLRARATPLVFVTVQSVYLQRINAARLRREEIAFSSADFFPRVRVASLAQQARRLRSQALCVFSRIASTYLPKGGGSLLGATPEKRPQLEHGFAFLKTANHLGIGS